MNAVPFVDLTAGDGYWLSDLKPQGYLANSNFSRRGTDGQFQVQLLTEKGVLLAAYSWKHVCSNGKWADEGFWNDPSAQKVVPHQKGSDYFFKQGTGLWMTSPAKSKDDASASYIIGSAGGVETNDVIWKLAEVAGAVAVANPYPVAIKLSSLTPTGYLNNKTLAKSGVAGQFAVQLLNEKGGAVATYKWMHSSGKSGWQDNARWVDPNNQDVVAGGENDLTIEPGQGLWVFAPAHNGDVGNDYTVLVKCPKF